jgi:hypothetical protein
MNDSIPANHAPRQRAQFTMRTFFVAAVLVSLFATAAALPGPEAKVVAIAFLVWLTFAGIYWTFRGIGPLVALPVGTVVAGIVMGLTLPVVLEVGRAPGMHRSDVWMAIPAAFGWGVLFSIFVTVSGVIRFVGRRLKRRLSGLQMTAFPRGDEPRMSPLTFAVGVVLVRLLVSAILIAAPNSLERYIDVKFAAISLLVDAPLVPLVVGVFCPSPPASSQTFILATAPLYLPLYAVTAGIAGATRNWILRSRELFHGPIPPPPVPEPEQASSTPEQTGPAELECPPTRPID